MMSTNSTECYHVGHGDCPGGPLDLNGVELQEPEKGHAFDEMWGVKKGE